MILRMILLCSLVICGCKEIEPETASASVPDIAEATAVSNDNYILREYNYDQLSKLLTTESDSIYVVNFWATWCAPCIKELPYFEELGEKYKTRKLKVLLVSLDFPSKYETLLKPYILKNQLKSEVIALNDPDANSWIPKVSEEWSGAIPATLIFDKDRRKFFEKSFEYAELEEEIIPFIK